MNKNKKDIIRNVRIDNSLDTALKIIASYEDRSISNIIQRLLKIAISEYLENENTPQFTDFIINNISMEDRKELFKYYGNKIDNAQSISDFINEHSGLKLKAELIE